MTWKKKNFCGKKEKKKFTSFSLIKRKEIEKKNTHDIFLSSFFNQFNGTLNVYKCAATTVSSGQKPTRGPKQPVQFPTHLSIVY